MAEKPSSSDAKSFAQFLNEQPAPAETVTMTGYVSRSARQGLFVLNAGGETLELPVDAVQSYRVLSEAPQKLVELQVIGSKIDTSKVVKPIVADVGVHTNPFLDHHYTVKEVITDPLVDKHVYKDPIRDPITIPEGIIPDPTNTLAEGVGGIDPGGIVTNPAAQGFAAQGFAAQPFVLATPHHAPASTIAAQMGAAGMAQLAKTPIQDIHTIIWYDRSHTLKELTKDPILDPITWREGVIPDLPNTIQEGIGGVDPGGILTNPAAGAQFAAQPMMAFAQGGAGISAQPKNPLADNITTVLLDRPHTHPYLDSPQTPFYFDHHTIKEMTKDPITDPITWVEGIGGGGGPYTIQEGVGGPGGITTNPVWNLPGMMF
jgi:hypothetical protein